MELANDLHNYSNAPYQAEMNQILWVLPTLGISKNKIVGSDFLLCEAVGSDT